MLKINFASLNYPRQLRQIDHPPENLYYRGDIDLLSQPAIAVIGSRQPTDYGRQVTETFVRQLVKQNWIIVSGMARGIDTVAHQTAIESGGKTIAVLGSGLDVIYPPENRDLSQKIHLVISEFSPGTPPCAKNFPQRNRILAGVSRAVLVTQAAKRSGTLITARLAAEQGKEVFVIPGPITSHLSEGSSWLIQQGAKLVNSIEDITEELTNLTEHTNLPL